MASAGCGLAGRQFEVLLHDQQAGDELLFATEEGLHIGVGVADDAFGGFGMAAVEVEFFVEVAVVGLEVDVVDFGLQAAFHQPGFVNGAGHEAEGLGGEYPFEVGGDVVAFDAEDVFVLQLLADTHEISVVGLVCGFFVYAADVAQGVFVVSVQEAQALFLVGGASPHQLATLGGERQAVGVDVEMAYAVEFEQHGVSVVRVDGSAFHKGGLRRNMGYIAEFVGKAGVCGEIAQQGSQVVVVGGGMVVAFEAAGLPDGGKAT